MRIIRLTEAFNRRAATYVQAEAIDAVEVADRTTTLLYLRGGQTLQVCETPERIIALMHGIEFNEVRAGTRREMEG